MRTLRMSRPFSLRVSALFVTGPAHGILTLHADGSFVYVPNGSFVGLDYFSYKLNDSAVDSSPVAVTINVTNENPLAQNDVASTMRSTSVSVFPSGA